MAHLVVSATGVEHLDIRKGWVGRLVERNRDRGGRLLQNRSGSRDGGHGYCVSRNG